MMDMRFPFLIVFFIFCSTIHLSAADEVIYIAPWGNDLDVGTKDKPMKTLSCAISLSRKTHIKEIVMRQGQYYDVNVELGPTDSGLIIRNYKNEEVCLFGGVPITNFIKEGKLIVAELPASKTKWDFRMLLVDGAIAMRSRLPESGFYSYQNVWDAKPLPAMYGYWDRKPTDDNYRQMFYKPEDGKIWIGEIKNAEIALIQQWDESYVKSDTISPSSNMVLFNYRASMPLGSYKKNHYVVWNTKAGLRPGTWYWDKQYSKVYYWPMEGENVKSMIVPTQNVIVSMGRGTKNIRLQGLTLSMATTRICNEEFACGALDAAIRGTNIENIVLNNVRIVNTGGNGISLSGKYVSIDNLNTINCGGTGIYFRCDSLQISNSNIQHLGVVYKSAVGIYGYGKRIVIRNSNIIDTPYAGIELGCDSVEISGCSVQKYMSVLQDGGAIQCGGHKSIDVNNNYIEGILNRGFTIGIYFDERSQDCKVSNNVLINSGIPVHCHMAKNITFTNNLFIDKGKQHINYAGSSDIQLDRNMFIADSIIFNGPSISDKKVDTLTMEPKYRKYANPTGVKSFRNNLIYLIKQNANKTNLPILEKYSLVGSKIMNIDNNKIEYIINGTNEGDFFDKDLIRQQLIQWKILSQKISNLFIKN
ncbi:MAG: right-handed parallel beta-helix repeat-containing protein [Dysgonamonadaceae bacterium]